MSLNDNGKRLWNRTYTGAGEIESLCLLPDNHILLAGNHWRAKIDPRGYLKWESAFSITDSMLQAVVLPRGEILYAGLRNRNKTVLIKTAPDNKVIYEKEISLPEAPCSVSSIFNTGPAEMMALMNFKSYQLIGWINALQGEIQKTVRIPSGLFITGMRRDMEGNLILSAFTGEILLIRNAGIAF
jgi:hypothetical protein